MTKAFLCPCVIYYFTPFALNKNLGKAYNQYASLVPKPDDWIVFTDGDVCFLTSDYGKVIAENIERHKQISLFTCLTNRVGCRAQCYQGQLSDSVDMLGHIEIAERLAANNRHEIRTISRVISGHVMIIKKKTWDAIGGAPDGLLGVDNKISKSVLNIGGQIAVMQGLYVFHKYRMGTHSKDVSHLM